MGVVVGARGLVIGLRRVVVLALVAPVGLTLVVTAGGSQAGARARLCSLLLGRSLLVPRASGATVVAHRRRAVLGVHPRRGPAHGRLRSVVAPVR